MTNETMSVHKALAEIKILNDRIFNATASAIFCKSSKATGKIDGISQDDFKKRIQSDYDKVYALICRRNAIKKSLSLSNASTEVEISGKKYYIAEAIDMKSNGVENLKQLLNEMKRQYAKQIKILQDNNGENLENRADKYIETMFDKQEKGYKNEEVTQARSVFIKNHTMELIDPITIAERIEALENEIDSFVAEVDSAISVSNALTNIEVSY